MFFTDQDPSKNESFVRKKPNFKSMHQSYEDLLVNNYIENIEDNSLKHKPQHKKKNLEIESPYLQKLPHSNFSLFNNRPSSSIGTFTNTSNRNKKNSPDFTEQKTLETHWLTNNDIKDKYDVYKSNRYNNTSDFNRSNAYNTANQSSKNNVSFRNRPSSAPTNKKNNSIMKQPNMIKAMAFRNGNPHSSVFISAKNTMEFLKLATEKLELTRAARRIFLENGEEIRDQTQFFKNIPVYISSGEDFIDPFAKTKRIGRTDTLWLSDGVRLLFGEADATKPIEYNERQMKSIKFTRRLVAFINGQDYRPVVIPFEVMNSDKEINKSEEEFLEDFLNECTSRLNMTRPAFKVYNWLGDKVESVNDVPKLDSCLRTLVCDVEYSPVWVSTGEGFDAFGALKFVEKLIYEVKQTKKKFLDRQSKLEEMSKDLEKNSSSKNHIKLQRLENAESLKKARNDISSIVESINNLKEIMEQLESLYSKQRELKDQNCMKFDDLMLIKKSKRPLKLTVLVNGSSEEDSFNALIDPKEMKFFEHVLVEIEKAYSRHFNCPYVKFTRVFDENGKEIEIITYEHQGKTIWVSSGEEWKDPKLNLKLSVSVKLDMVVPVPLKSSDAPKNPFEDDYAPETRDVPKNPFEDDNPAETNEEDNSEDESVRRKPGNPFKTKESNAYNFKTILEDLRVDWLKDFSKPEDWDILTEERCIRAVDNIISKSGSSMFVEHDKEIDQKKVVQLMLQAKNNTRLLIYPQVELNTKIQLKPKESIWSSKFQIWKFSKEGLIYNGFFKRLCLCVNTQVAVNLEVNLKEGRKIIQKGYMVTLSARDQRTVDQHIFEANRSKSGNLIDMNHKWGFNKQGNIVTKVFDNNAFCLTSLNVLAENLSVQLKQSDLEGHEFKVECDAIDYKLADISLVVMEPFWKSTQDFSDSLSKTQIDFLNHLGKSQQWAIRHNKAEAIRNREWRLSTLTTNKWGKEWYSWPINEDEKLIEEYTWPISGYLIPSAPPLKSKGEQETSPIKIKICKNGSVNIFGPITIPRMKQAQALKKIKEKRKDGDRSDINLLKKETIDLLLFLNECSELLALPSAARRAFTDKGEEIKSLETLVQDQLVYISMGEAWIEPKTVKEELDRKRMLVNLADDLNKLAYFNMLRNGCQNFVIEHADGMQKMVVGFSFLNNEQLERVKQGEALEVIFGLEKAKPKSENKEPKRAHHRSHENCDAEEKKKLHRPWEVTKDKKDDNDDIFCSESNKIKGQYSDEDEDVIQMFDSLSNTEKSTNQGSLKKFESPKLSNQRFAFDKQQGFIYKVESPDLVLGVHDTNANQIEVILMKRNENNPFQRWVYSKSGSILLKSQQNLALTVKLPSLENVDVNSMYHRNKENLAYLNNQNSDSIINNSQLILQNVISTEYGNVNQKWYIEDNVKSIFAFAPTYDRNYDKNDQLNIEVTAANKAQICSAYIGKDNKISQPGYLCELITASKLPAAIDNPNKSLEHPTNSTRKVYICSCCAVSVYGKFKLTKLTKNEAFACFFGLSNEKIHKQYGGFKHLYDKVDLSSQEKSENALLTWKETLITLRGMTVAKPMFQEISAAQTKDVIKLYAYKNGNGRLKAGELLIGTGLDELLEAATFKLGFNVAARRIYTQDGTVVLSIQDLVIWCVDYYKKQLQLIEPTEQKNTRRPKSSLSSPSDKFSSTFRPASTISSSDMSENKKGCISQESAYLKEYSFYPERKNNNFKKPNKYDLKRLIFEISQLKVPDTKKVLKWPVEVWISTGEEFIHPDVVDANEIQKNRMKERVKRVENFLDKKNHELRQMKGKRMAEKNVGELVPTSDLHAPVVKEGHWTSIPYDEQLKQKEVEVLKGYVNDMKTPSKRNGTSKSYNNVNSATKRVFVYNNGYSCQKTQSCIAASLQELSDEAREKLKLTKPIKLFFSTDGQMITKFDQINRDQVICISTGGQFIPESDTNKNVEIRANWSRVRKEEGFGATLISVNPSTNPHVNVDPFATPNRKSQFLAIKD